MIFVVIDTLWHTYVRTTLTYTQCPVQKKNVTLSNTVKVLRCAPSIIHWIPKSHQSHDYDCNNNFIAKPCHCIVHVVTIGGIQVGTIATSKNILRPGRSVQCRVPIFNFFTNVNHGAVHCPSDNNL